MALTPDQVKQYYATEGTKATPLSPTDWLAQQNTQPAAQPVVTAAQPITYNVDSANNPATLMQMPSTGSMPDWRATLASLPTTAAIAGEQSPEQIAAAGEQKTLQQKILDMMSGLGEKVGMLDKQTGMSDTQNELNDVYGQIGGLQQEAQAIPLQVQAASEGRGRTEAGVAPLEADLVRNNTIKALGLSARASVLSGKLGQAKQQMDRLVQVQQMELNYLGKALEFNKDRMSEADKAQSTRIQIRLKEQQDALDKQRSEGDQVMQMLLKAKLAGAPDNIIAQAHALDPVGAAGLLAPYLKESAGGFTLNAGDVRYDANGKVIAAAPAKPTAGDKPTFTTTQTNSGAANAGMSLAAFAQLDGDTQNYFINSFKSSQLAKDVQAVQSGGKTTDGEDKQQVAHGVATSNLPEAVKQAILAMLGVSMAEASTEANAGGGWWSTILGGGRSLVKTLTGI